MNENAVITPDILSMPLHTNGKEKKPMRSDLAQEIISREPDFIERWALLLFLGILLLLLGCTWFIQYPDIIEATATLTAYNGPKEIIPLQEGRLVKLLTHNDEIVTDNQIIGWIESTASHEEVIDLSRQLDSSISFLLAGKAEKVSGLFRQRYEHLGELQTGYQQFIAAWQQFNDYMVNGFYNQKRKMLEQDISSLHQMNATVSNQKALTDQDIQLAEESFKMNDILLKEKIISKEEYRVEKSKFLNKKSAIPQLDASLISNENQQRDKQKEIFQLDHDVAQQKIIFEQALQTLKSNVDDWMRRYVLRSPINGKVVFTMPLQENKFLQQGKLIGYIVPDNAQYYAEVNLSQNNFGKIDTGLQVQLRFDAYPYQEFGFVKGRLNYISRVSSDSGFLATVHLDNGIITNHNNKIQYKNGLKAQAIIVTKNLRLFQRIYYNIVKATSVKK
jgi:HlyD family secretion protein